jgi:hypothetical protein
MSEVVYKEIPEFVGYRVGSDGSFWSCRKRIGKGKGHGKGTTTIFDKWKKLSPGLVQGYPCVRLSRRPGEKRIPMFIHYLVLLTFVGHRPEGMHACHFPDPTRTNCRLDNLRWDTPDNNYADAIIHGTAPLGEKQYQAILTDEQARQIYLRRKAGERGIDLAKAFGVLPTTIANIFKGRSWTHVTGLKHPCVKIKKEGDEAFCRGVAGSPIIGSSDFRARVEAILAEPEGTH